MYHEIQQIFVPKLNDHKKDNVCWIHDNVEKRFSAKVAWISLRGNGPNMEWHHVVWYSQFNLRQTFILWLAVQGKLLTQDRKRKWQKDIDLRCSLCKECEDNYNHNHNHVHFFFMCRYSMIVWNDLRQNARISSDNNELQDERNRKLFKNEANKVDELCMLIEDNVYNGYWDLVCEAGAAVGFSIGLYKGNVILILKQQVLMHYDDAHHG
ncbi:retrovirus-related pol polyprotein from transposon TNT 1-94 [Tanacetum coccineum]